MRYVAGTVLQASGGPKSWPAVQWATAVGYEARKHVADVHKIDIELEWEEEFAAAARHGSKFLDRRHSALGAHFLEIESLAEATHASFFPANRRGRAFLDFLRKDLSVVSAGREILLTNVTGHSMVGLPSDRAARLEVIGTHVRTLTTGLGQLSAKFTGADVSELALHGNAATDKLTWWDGKMNDLPSRTFGGELDLAHCLSLIGLLASAQAANRWARATCCDACDAAALKHRFVSSHHLARSISALTAEPSTLGPIARQVLSAMAGRGDALTLTSNPYRALRNGWLHLGFSDAADRLTDPIDLRGPVRAYTGTSAADLEVLVDRYLGDITNTMNEWLLLPAREGEDLFDHLKRVNID